MTATAARESGADTSTHASEATPPYWAAPLADLLHALRTSPAGLSSAEASRRLAVSGPNVATPRRRSGPWRLLLSQFASPITVLLLVAAVLSMALGEQTDGLVILAILVVSGGLGFWQEYNAAGAVERLLSLVRTTTTVVRDGEARDIPLEHVVPGDIVRLSAGMSVPGDARLLEARDLFVDEAALTGESFPADKSSEPAPTDAPLPDRDNVVHFGTYVVSGTGTALVVRTGADTEFGAIAQRLALRAPETEFEHGVRRFGYLLLEITMVLVIVIFTINVALHRPVIDALLFTLALAVGLTPQLLPAIVSVTLAQGARHMARERVIVRRLASIEDLGGMEILCTDKTGTITEGTVGLHGAEDCRGAPSERVRLFAHLNAAFETGYPNPIDEALRAVSVEGAERYAKSDEVPYDFVRRRLSVVVTDRDSGARVLISKGALASILDVCDRVELADGQPVALDDVRDAIEARFEALSRDGYRCLGVAVRALDAAEQVSRSSEHGLAFLGILSVSDPMKAGVAETLDELARLGVRVKLITGDNRHVAARVASEARLDGDEVCTGSDVHRLSDAALVSVAARVHVFAEIEPNQKERIILALKKAGYAVGYLGDGINDAAALHAADVGISVDSATDVTKHAADVVLLEKDLAVLGAGVREGRRAFANTLKYVFITTSANFGNMLSMAGASLFATFLPLLPKQILLINVLSDLPAMAIATDSLDPELVERPRRWNNANIRRFMLTFGLVSSVFDFVTFGTLLALRAESGAFRTAWFLESTLSEIFILLVIRTRRPFFRSRIGTGLLWASILVTGGTLVLPFSPLADLLGFVAITPQLLGLVLFIVAAYVAVAEITKRGALRFAHL